MVCVCVCGGWGGGYSEFSCCIGQDFFLWVGGGGRILNFTIFGGLGEKWLFKFRVLAICRYFLRGHFLFF